MLTSLHAYITTNSKRLLGPSVPSHVMGEISSLMSKDVARSAIPGGPSIASEIDCSLWTSAITDFPSSRVWGGERERVGGGLQTGSCVD